MPLARPLLSAPVTLAIAVCASAAALVTAWVLRPAAAPAMPPALASMEGMGHLVSLKVRYANVIAFTQQRTQGIPWTQWELRLGGTQVLLVARGECLVGTDLRGARYTQLDGASRSATLHLPSPTTVSAKVDHGPRDAGGSYFYAVQDTGIEPLIPGTTLRTLAIDTALQQAQADLERSCQTPSTVETARTLAEEALRPLFAATGWQVTVAWE